MVPVDTTSLAIIDIMLQNEKDFEVFHVATRTQTFLSHLIDLIDEKRDKKIERVNAKEFRKIMSMIHERLFVFFVVFHFHFK